MTVSPYLEDKLPVNICNDGNLGVIVFYSAIKTLKFEAVYPKNAIVSTRFQSSDNCYILCVQPQESTNFSIKISAPGFYSETYNTGSLRAKEKKIFTVKSEYKPPPPTSLSSPEHANWIAPTLSIAYPFHLGISVIGRHGVFKNGLVGVGYQATLGIIDDWDPVYAHYSIGLKIFPYQNVFLSANYGALGQEKMTLGSDGEGRWWTDGSRQRKGFSFLGGYDLVWGKSDKYVISLGAGFGHDAFMDKWIPVIEIKLGIAFEL